MLNVDGRGSVTFHNPDDVGEGMTRSKAEQAAKKMVDSLHAAGQRAVREAIERRERDEERQQEEREMDLMERAVQFLQVRQASSQFLCLIVGYFRLGFGIAFDSLLRDVVTFQLDLGEFDDRVKMLKKQGLTPQQVGVISSRLCLVSNPSHP